MLIYFWIACTNLPSTQVRRDKGQFFTHPWPSNTRLLDGRPDISDFPNPTENPLIDRFIEEGLKLDGFGTNSPIYFPLNGSVEIELLPSASESLKMDSNVVLLNIDSESDYRGELIPIHWDFQSEATNWQPENLLSVAPVWGFPLRPATQYAAILTTELVNYDALLPTIWEDYESWYTSQNPREQEQLSLYETWRYLDRPVEDIGSFTIFTTQDPIKEMMLCAHRIETELSTPLLNPMVDIAFETETFIAFDGELLLPLWQYGQKPYSNEGGGFAFEQGERPQIFSWDDAKFRISVPTSEMPLDGWPIAIYSHGTGGNYSTFANSADALEPAKVLADAGFLGIGISQPIHAERGTGADPEIYSFNFLNPTSARSMFRQGALDQIYLAKLLSSQPQTFNLGDRNITTNPQKVVFVGHSHGGEVGAIAMPFIGQYIQAAVLSGAGGGLSITLMEREQDAGGLNIQDLLRNAINLADNETLDTFHPAVGLVQMLAEVVDPLNYAPYWFSESVYWDHQSSHILMTEGMMDEYTPPASIEILAAAARIPIIGDPSSINTAQKILQLGNPTQADLNGEDSMGISITTGLVQYPEDGHFAIFYNEFAGQTYQEFLSSSLDRTPIIVPY